MDVYGRILRAWMPAIHTGMTEAADGKMLSNMGVGGGMSLYFHALRRA